VVLVEVQLCGWLVKAPETSFYSRDLDPDMSTVTVKPVDTGSIAFSLYQMKPTRCGFFFKETDISRFFIPLYKIYIIFIKKDKTLKLLVFN
jgi:hypothetical protein